MNPTRTAIDKYRGALQPTISAKCDSGPIERLEKKELLP